MSSMNFPSSSGSMDNYGCCNRDNSSERDRHHRRHRSEPGDSILNANTGSLGPVTIPITAPLLQAEVNEPIASVSIDTRGLDDPTILVQFLGTLTTIATTPANLNFTFTLFRNCRRGISREQLKTFTVSQVISAVGAPGQITFLTNSTGLSFAFSQNENDCFENECCTYTLELTRVSSTVPVTLIVSVSGTLSVLAVGEGEDGER